MIYRFKNRGQKWITRQRILFIVLFCCVLYSPYAQASSTSPTKSDSVVQQQLTTLYRSVGASFWRGEKGLLARREAEPDSALLSSPLASDDPLREDYTRAAAAADQWLAFADQQHIQNWMNNPVIYLGSLAHYTLGNYARAAELFSRLAPDYRRYRYFNSRDLPDPDYAQPTLPGISKLLLFAQIQALPAKPNNAFAALQQFTAQALSALAAQRAFAALVASHSTRYNRYQFDETRFGGERYGGEPDQRRAGALPPTLALVQVAWNALLEKSLAQVGAVKVRAFLRGLSVPADAPLAMLALDKLQGIDGLLIKQLFAEAQNLKNAHNFDGARQKLRQLIADYPESDTSRQAEAELQKIVPIAVTYYKSEGDQNFHPRDGTPQSQSIAYYQKMYQEDPDGPQSDYALFKWGEALATDVKQSPQSVARLQEFLKKYPNSPLADQALYTLGLVDVHPSMNKIAEGIKILMQVPRDYPQSEVASEALWMASFKADVVLSDYPTALEAMRQLHDKYPNSPRWKHTQAWIDYYKQVIAEAGSK